MRWRGIGAAAITVMLAAGGGAVQAQQATREIKVGNLSAVSDAGIFIADKLGYFKSRGLDVKLTTFRSAADMVPSLGTGQIDVGGGSPSAGLYNAALRDVKMRIVADKAYSPPGYSGTLLIIAKDIMDSGRFKSLTDLKGMKIATNAPGVSNQAMLNTALRSVGLAFGDVTTLNLPFTEHPTALRNKAVEAGATIEPFATRAIEEGSAVLFMRDDQIDPGHQIACILYSEAFARDRREDGVKFMAAYLEGVRLYNRALKDGRLGGETAGQVIDILAEYTPIKDKKLLAKISSTGLHPDGAVNVASLQRDLEFYASQGLFNGKLAVKELVDTSFIEAALKLVGPAR